MVGLSFGFCLDVGDNAIHSDACNHFKSLENDLIGVCNSWYPYSWPKAKWLAKAEDGQPSTGFTFFLSHDVNAGMEKVQ